jgi:hypothetical protein
MYQNIRCISVDHEVFTAVEDWHHNCHYYHRAQGLPSKLLYPFAFALPIGTMLQVGKSLFHFPIRSMDFSTDIILPAAIRPLSGLSLEQKGVAGTFLVVKVALRVRLTTSRFL